MKTNDNPFDGLFFLWVKRSVYPTLGLFLQKIKGFVDFCVICRMKLLKGGFGMRNFVKVLGIMLVLLMLVLPGKTAFAHGDDCECGVTTLQGAERNKAVANTLKLNEFSKVKSDLGKQGYVFAGADQVMAVTMPGPEGVVFTIVAVPFVHINGEVLFAGFTNGEFMGAQPPLAE